MKMNYNKKNVINDMKNCEQMKDLSVLEHGTSVARYFQDLKNHILFNKPLKFQWKLPEWIYDQNLWQVHLSTLDIYKYQIFHDCGKPYCLEIDDSGRKHFPNHAEISHKVAQSFLNDEISDLIKNDMVAHLTKPSESDTFIKIDNYKILLITAMCEIHSNAVMFGGIESQSFKIKHKKLSRLGKNVVKSINEE